MKRRIMAASVALLLGTAAVVTEPVYQSTKVFADDIAPGPRPGSGNSGGTRNSGNSGGAYVGIAVACSAISLIGNAIYVGGVYQRQLTSNEALSKVLGCFVPGLGYVFMAFNPNTPQSLYAARIAWLWEQIPWVSERIQMERQTGGFPYPSLQQMLRDLRAAGFRV